MTLYNKVNYYKEMLENLKEKQSTCSKCDQGSILTDKKVYISEEVSFLFKGCKKEDDKYFYFEHIECECNKINDMTSFDIQEKIKYYQEKVKGLDIIPIEYRNCDIDLIDCRIASFMKNDKIFLWLCGKTGTGKTYAVNALKIEEMSKGKDIEIIKEYSLTYKDIDKYKSIMMCIDDYGIANNENRNKNLLELYFELIDHKREKHSKLILTTNLTVKEWLDKMKQFDAEIVQRIASRMSNVTEIIELTGEDRRKVKE